MNEAQIVTPSTAGLEGRSHTHRGGATLDTSIGPITSVVKSPWSDQGLTKINSQTVTPVYTHAHNPLHFKIIFSF